MIWRAAAAVPGTRMVPQSGEAAAACMDTNAPIIDNATRRRRGTIALNSRRAAILADSGDGAQPCPAAARGLVQAELENQADDDGHGLPVLVDARPEEPELCGF